ncbi:MAG: Gfo/Idh/MocA family oxidoreductase [Phycisphaerae bacterium]|nr:Gfo/Idh/MocA family oxidoreductase [Phycisphaerae bacterium]
MADLRWAILGTGRIAAGVLPRLSRSTGNIVVAVASRDRVRAQELCDRASASADCAPVALEYEEIAGRAGIDAVYVTLPNSLHAEWSLRLLESGKHVLCEKPLCATRAEAERLATAARKAGRLCVEGFMYMHHPQTARLVELARGGSPIGAVRLIRSNRNVCNRDPYILSSRLNHSLRGGALMDIGCYPLSLALLVMGGAPEWSSLRASAELGRWVGGPSGGCIEKENGERVWIGERGGVRADFLSESAEGLVDESCSFSFSFPSGTRFEGECSFTKGAADGASVFFEMIGERGRAYTTHPFSPDPDRQVLLVESDGKSTEEVFERGGDKFVNQFERFARAARGEVAALPSMDWSLIEAEAIERIHSAVGVRW